MLSGYLGDPGAGDVVLDAAARVRNYNDGALYCCDPVMGDAGAVYVGDGIVAFMRDRAAPAADVLTPNLFELALLSDSPSGALANAPLGEIIAAARKLITPERRTTIVLVTSVVHQALPPGHVAMAAVAETGA